MSIVQSQKSIVSHPFWTWREQKTFAIFRAIPIEKRGEEILLKSCRMRWVVERDNAIEIKSHDL